MIRWMVLFCVLFFVMPNISFASMKIGYIDLREALNSVADGQEAKKKLEERKSKFQMKLSKMQTDLKDAKKKYDARVAILRGPAKQRLQEKLQKKFVKLQQTYTMLTRKLAKDESQETRKIFGKMRLIINGIAQDNGLVLMLEKTESSVLFAQTSMNYTSELVRRYNRLYGKGKKITKSKSKTTKQKKTKKTK